MMKKMKSLLGKMDPGRLGRAAAIFGKGPKGWPIIIGRQPKTTTALMQGKNEVVYRIDIQKRGKPTCSCPDGQKGNLCKHIGTLALLELAVHASAREKRQEVPERWENPHYKRQQQA